MSKDPETDQPVRAVSQAVTPTHSLCYQRSSLCPRFILQSSVLFNLASGSPHLRITGGGRAGWRAVIILPGGQLLPE